MEQQEWGCATMDGEPGDNRAGRAETAQPCLTVPEGDEQIRPCDSTCVQPRAQITRQVHSDGAGPEVTPGS